MLFNRSEIAVRPAKQGWHWSVWGAQLLVLMCLVTGAVAQEDLPPRTSTPPPDKIQAEPNPPAQDAAQQGDDKDASSDGFVFKTKVTEIVLHAIVVDPQNRLITGLPRESFQVLEDGKAQKLTSFRKEQVPIALGILIDNSSSMYPKREKVNEAALQLVNASKSEDQVFIVNFGDDAFLDQDYTQDVGKLKAALERVETGGSTALFDAIIGATDHLVQTSNLPKKILLAITDGHDNASQATFQQTLRKLQQKDGPVLYTIALANEGRDDSDRQALTALSEQTGGTAFFPATIADIQSIATTIAQDIRSQYVIGYHSSNSHTPGAYHAIQVQAVEGTTPFRVQTRTGYYASASGDPIIQ